MLTDQSYILNQEEEEVEASTDSLEEEEGIKVVEDQETLQIAGIADGHIHVVVITLKDVKLREWKDMKALKP